MDIQRLEMTLGSKDGLFFELEDFFKYMIGHQPTNDELMLLTHHDYCDIFQTVVQAAYEVAISAQSAQSQNNTSSNANVSVNATIFSVLTPVQAGTAPQFSHINLSANTHGHVTPAMICTVDSIRYTIFSLAGTEDILKFCSDVQAQGIQYNIILEHIDHITPTGTLYLHDLPMGSIELTSGTLIYKLRQEKLVSSCWTKSVKIYNR